MKVLTGWYEGVDPVRVGLYLVHHGKAFDEGVIAKWDGQSWRWADGTLMTYLPKTWRGLAFDPNKAAHGTVIGEITDGKCITGDVWLVEVPR